MVGKASFRLDRTRLSDAKWGRVNSAHRDKIATNTFGATLCAVSWVLGGKLSDYACQIQGKSPALPSPRVHLVQVCLPAQRARDGW